MGRLHSIQIMRCIAVALVVLIHSNITLTLGSAGVDIFFVISGFIIAKVAAGRGPIEFIVDRIRRIYPLWIMACIPFAAALIPVRGVDAGMVLTSLTLWPVYDDYYFPYLTAGWSLSFEMLFYSAAAMVLWRRKLIAPIIASFAIALALALITKWPLFRFVGNPIVLEFAMGVAIAHLPTYNRKVGTGLILLSLAGFAFSIPASGRLLWVENLASLDTPWRFAQWGLPAAALVAGALQFEASLKGRLARALEYGGDASYSIYLAHMLPALALRHVLPWPITFLVAVGTGLIVYRFVELPVQQSLRALGRKRRIDAEVPAIG